MTRTVIVGTRGSALAQWQTGFVVDSLKRIAPDLKTELRIVKTEGDKDQVRPLAELGGLGVFTKALQDALLTKEIDIAVHSLKDMPTEPVRGLEIAAIPERADPRDCIVSRHRVSLLQLPRGARVGTSSARRTAQVLALRPDMKIVPLRGNVDTRLAKAQSDEYDAVILAAAGITRLGRADEITDYINLDSFLPDPGQGALAVEIRADDEDLAALVRQLDHAPTRAATTAEHAFLAALGGGCRMPIGAIGHTRDQELVVKGLVASSDGRQIVRGEVQGRVADAESVGTRLGVELLTRGANKILDMVPLEGKRILITRAAGQARTLSDKIHALGGIPVELPAIEFAPLDDYTLLDAALCEITAYEWIVFTSANGVRAVADRLFRLSLEPQHLQSAKLAAIGPATAQEMERVGLSVDFIPTKYVGEQVAAELPAEPGARVLLLRADIASPVLARGLKERGLTVTNIDAYRTVTPAKRDIDPEQVDAVTFTSSSTVDNLCKLLGRDKQALVNAAIFCIGPVTAATVRENGINPSAVASEHTIDGLVAAMVRFYQQSAR